MNDFHSNMPLKRQVRYLQQCRDNWKKNSAKKQKKIREYVQLTRSLQNSRDNWRNRALAAEQRVKELEQQLAELSSSQSDQPNSQEQSPQDPQDEDSSDDYGDNDDLSLDLTQFDSSELIPNHHYPTNTILMAVQQFITAGNTYRGIATTLEILSSSFPLTAPHYTTIKSWVERLGLYELLRPKPHRYDWLFLVDLTLELGNLKALTIYGISQQVWLHDILPFQRALTHHDGQILALEVTTQATGEWIFSVLLSLSQQVGCPLQIVADHAPNLKKGIQLFQARYPHVVYTYDVTHAMANLLEKELSSHDTFQNFLSDCHQCRLQIQQTELAFACPPPSRYASIQN